GPPFGSSNGIQFATIVTVSGLSGLTKAYRSVLSNSGTPAISGASRWLDAPPTPGRLVAARPATANAATAPAPARRGAMSPPFTGFGARRPGTPRERLSADVLPFAGRPPVGFTRTRIPENRPAG